jgi:hypothetical protein
MVASGGDPFGLSVDDGGGEEEAEAIAEGLGDVLGHSQPIGSEQPMSNPMATREDRRMVGSLDIRARRGCVLALRETLQD